MRNIPPRNDWKCKLFVYHQTASAKCLRTKIYLSFFINPSRHSSQVATYLQFIILSLGCCRGIKETGNERQKGITAQKRVNNTPSHVVWMKQVLTYAILGTHTHTLHDSVSSLTSVIRTREQVCNITMDNRCNRCVITKYTPCLSINKAAYWAVHIWKVFLDGLASLPWVCGSAGHSFEVYDQSRLWLSGVMVSPTSIKYFRRVLCSAMCKRWEIKWVQCLWDSAHLIFTVKVSVVQNLVWKATAEK